MDDKIYVEVKLVGGGRMYINREQVIGYCHFPEHKGSVTKTIFKEHKCDEKKCMFFQKYTDRNYWTDYNLRINAKKRHIEEKKKAKKERKAQPQELLRIAQSIAEKLDYNIKILRVRFVPSDNIYKIFYISPKPCNDYYDYWGLVVRFGYEMEAKVELIHMKDQSGRYAVLEEEPMEENDTVKRITEMEKRFDKARAAVDLLQNAIQNYMQTMEDIKLLQEYYTSDDWKDDFSADEAGELPQNLKRGVLSEDGVWFLLEDNKKLKDAVIRLNDELNDDEKEPVSTGL